MIASTNGNIFRASGPWWGESTGHRWIPLKKTSDEELWCFLWSTPEQTIEQTIETPVSWDALALIMTSLYWHARNNYPSRNTCNKSNMWAWVCNMIYQISIFKLMSMYGKWLNLVSYWIIPLPFSIWGYLIEAEWRIFATAYEVIVGSDNGLPSVRSQANI